MDYIVLLKGSFFGYALCLGTLMVVFFLVGSFRKLTAKDFNRVFLLAAIASFLVVDGFLYYKVRVDQAPQSPFFGAGVVGGWLGGIFSGLTHMRRFLLTMRR